jgi:uncharacterized protein
MPLTEEAVRGLFRHLQTDDADLFFEHVADGVSWTVMGTHPLAGHYTLKKEFIESTFVRLNKLLVGGVALKVNHIIVSGDEAVVEMVSLSNAKNGKPFDNTYCWVVRFEGETIVEVRAYVDSVAVQRVIDEND